MSRAASFLVLENDQMFAAFGIERDAKNVPVEALGGPPKAPDSASFGVVGLLDNRPSELGSLGTLGHGAGEAPPLGAVIYAGHGRLRDVALD